MSRPYGTFWKKTATHIWRFEYFQKSVVQRFEYFQRTVVQCLEYFQKKDVLASIELINFISKVDSETYMLGNYSENALSTDCGSFR